MTHAQLVRSLVWLLPVIAAGCTAPPPEPAPQAGAASTPAASQPAVVILSPEKLRNAGLTVAVVESSSRSAQIVAPATLALDESRTARVGSLQEALILRTLAQEGDRVRPGQMLATMHGHAMHDAWAGYRKAKAEQRRLEKELAYAVDTHERTKRLYDDKAIPLQEVKRADLERTAAEEHLVAAKAEVYRSIEELEHVGVSIDPSGVDNPAAPEPPAEAAAEEIPVRTPIGGTVLDRLVTPGTTVTPGTPLYVISDLSTLWALAQVDEGQAPHVSVGQQVALRVAAYPDESFSGTVSFVADRIDPDTRRLTIRSTIPNSDRRLKPDMYATVSISGATMSAMVAVPRRAIQTLNGRPTVFVAQAEGRFEPRAVTLGAATDSMVDIVSGLAVGERIVVDGGFVLKAELLKSTEGGN